MIENIDEIVILKFHWYNFFNFSESDLKAAGP